MSFNDGMRWLVLLMLTFGATAQAEGERWHRAVGLLEYLAGDYGSAVASGDADELAEQRGLADELVKQLEDSAYVAPARAIRDAIAATKTGPEVATACEGLALRIVTEQGLVRAPRQTPSLEDGARHYAANCSSCHGLTGAADTAVAKQLNPPPANFRDDARMRRLTPYKIFNTTRFGLQGTAMPAFPQFSEAERWADAFHVFALRQPACDHPPVSVGLAELATSTDEQLAANYGAQEVACLRRVLPRREEDPLTLAQAGLDDALTRYAQGDVNGARQAVVDAYLNGLEPIEPMLRARDPQLVGRLENAFTRSRLAAQSGQHFEAEVIQTQVLIGLAREGTRSSSFWSVFFAALFILLREGFEAVVVVGALLAVLKKLEARQHARVVHLGWVSALVVGGIAFIFGQRFFAGANREWLEAVVALVAVGFLLYAALWLNARANMSRFMGELRGKMTAALGTGSTAGLFFISFSSVGRESLETALFLQGLAVDSKDGVLWGAGAGLAALLGLVAMVRTVGFKLPMKTLFTASTVLLVATAVMLLGKGLHGLQELGVLPLRPIPFFAVEALGVFPDAISLVPQVLLSFAPLLWKMLPRVSGPTAPPRST